MKDSTLSVCLLQALYELPDERVTPEEVAALADEIEAKIQGGPAGRPLLAVPHILVSSKKSWSFGKSD